METKKSRIPEARQGTTPVQMRLRPKTLAKIEKLRALTGENKTQVVALCIDIAYTIAMDQQEGKKLIREYEDGRQVELEFVGL